MMMHAMQVRGLAIAGAVGMLAAPSLSESVVVQEYRSLMIVRYDANAIRLTDGLVQALEQDLARALVRDDDASVTLTGIQGGHSEGQPSGVYVAEFRFECGKVSSAVASEHVSKALARLLSERIGGGQGAGKAEQIQEAQIELMGRKRELNEMRRERSVIQRSDASSSVLRDLEQQLSVLRVEQSAEEASMNSLAQRLDLGMREIEAAEAEVDTRRAELEKKRDAGAKPEVLKDLEMRLAKTAQMRDFLVAGLNALSSERAAAGTRIEASRARMERLEFEMGRAAEEMDRARKTEAVIRDQLAEAENELAMFEAQVFELMEQRQKTSVKVSVWSISKSASKD